MTSGVAQPLPLLAKIALKDGLLDETQVARCQELLAATARDGAAVAGDLGEVALAEGLLSLEQLAALRTKVEQAQLWCPACRKPFAVLGLPPGRTLPCPTCKRPLRPRVSDGQMTTFVGGRPDETEKTTTIDDALVGQVLAGKYRLEVKIGQGGMGAVYRARQVQLDRAVAIKVLPHEMATDEALVARLRQEARATAQVESANIVQIFDADRDPALGIEFLAMELLSGRALDALLTERGRLSWREACALARQAAAGLGAAHAKGIIHRDVKPANLMLTTAGVVKVMDFGLARLAEGASHLSQTGQLLGTPHYMSPEQAQGEALDPRTDVYSLAVTLYLLATGRTPFQAPSAAALLLKVIDTEAPTVTSLVPDVPRELTAVIAKAMAKRKEDRHPTISAFAADLLAVEQGERTSVPTLSLPRLGRRQKARAARVALAIALMGGGIAAGSLFRGDPGPPAVAAREPSAVAFDELSAALLDGSVPKADQLARCRDYLAKYPDAPKHQAVRDFALTIERDLQGGATGSSSGSDAGPDAAGSASGSGSGRGPRPELARHAEIDRLIQKGELDRAEELLDGLPHDQRDKAKQLGRKLEIARIRELIAAHELDLATERLDAFEADADDKKRHAETIVQLRTLLQQATLEQATRPRPPPVPSRPGQLDLDEVWRTCAKELVALPKNPLHVAGVTGRAHLHPFGSGWTPLDDGLYRGGGLLALKLEPMFAPRVSMRFSLGKHAPEKSAVAFCLSRDPRIGGSTVHVLVGVSLGARLLTFAHVAAPDDLRLLDTKPIGELDLASPALELSYQPGAAKHSVTLAPVGKRGVTLEFDLKDVAKRLGRGGASLFGVISTRPAKVSILAVGAEFRLTSVEVATGR